MQNISEIEECFIAGGMNLNGLSGSANVIDQRGTDNGSWIDANGACWVPGTDSITMFPAGGGVSYEFSFDAFDSLMGFLKKSREGGGGPL
ncbi:hypothetical protein ACQK5W_17185 [Pantoea sp. FN060301]|uniref:hypothetical protein n=1 Tax=Pantoea sp. FN060301 TaxID=3420380 RepID=UPI003D1775C9